MLALGTQPSLAITPYDDVLVQQAAKDIQQENYDEALGQMTEAWNKGTHTAEKAFLFGQIYRLMLNYSKAKDYLQEALRLKPDFRPAQLMLADTLLALNKSKEARPILQNLLASGYEPGQTAFLMGVAATKEGQYSEALDYFRKAETEPKVAQEAKFQASLALAALNRVKEAKQAMAESIALNPQSQTADFAKRYMGILSQRADEQRPFRITVSSGFDYDSNVTLSPGGGTEATGVSVGTLYNYFENKEAVLQSIMDQHYSQLDEQLGLPFDSADPTRQLAQLIARVHGFIEEHRDLFQLYSRAEFDRQDSPKVATRASPSSVLERVSSRIQELLDQCQRSGRLRGDIPLEIVSWSLQATLQSLLADWYRNPDGFSLTHRGSELVALFFAGAIAA